MHLSRGLSELPSKLKAAGVLLVTESVGQRFQENNLGLLYLYYYIYQRHQCLSIEIENYLHSEMPLALKKYFFITFA